MNALSKAPRLPLASSERAQRCRSVRFPPCLAPEEDLSANMETPQSKTGACDPYPELSTSLTERLKAACFGG